MRVVTLFMVRVRHDYYADGVCTDLTFEPTAETRRLLAGYRLQLRPLPDGIAVLAEASADGMSPLIVPPKAQAFVFRLGFRNSDFSRFTDLQELKGKSAPVYTNAGLTPGGGKALRLRERESWHSETIPAPTGVNTLRIVLAGNPVALDGDASKPVLPSDFTISAPEGAVQVTDYDVLAKAITVSITGSTGHLELHYRVKTIPDVQTLAEVEVNYDPALSAMEKEAPVFFLKFKAQAAHWAYYLITDQPGEFAVVDSNTGGPVLGFSDTNRSVLNAAIDESDPFAYELARQYPNHQRVRFLSDQPVPCSSEVKKGLELRIGNEKLLGALPNPPVWCLSRIRKASGAGLQYQDTYRQVIKYLKAQ